MPSIQMLRPDLEGLPPLEPVVAALPPGYRLRTYRPGDEAGWAALMNTGDLGQWDVARVRAELTERPYPQFDPEGLFVLTSGAVEPAEPAAQIAGSACAWLPDPGERETGILHMVCVRPEHRGAGLSYPLCLAVLHRFRARGLRRVRLNTGDWRLGAVKVYLRLGFRPWYRRPEHPAIWREVLAKLSWPDEIEPITDLDPAALERKIPQ